LIKLAKYLKPFLLGLILAIILLFGQSLTDLNLPNYMADIVNVGIQQNGIESSAPEVISKDGLDVMKVFMTGEQKALAEKSYSLVNTEDIKISKSAKKIYDKISEDMKSADMYVKTADNSEELENAFGDACWTFINYMREAAEQQGQQPDSSLSTLSTENIDIKQIYQMMQPLVASNPPAEMFDSAREKSKDLDSTIKKQTGIAFAEIFYTELGVDVSKVQSSYIIFAGLLMLSIALLGGIATILVSLISSRIAAGVARNLRSDIFKKVQSFTNGEFDKYSTASLITRTTNDVTQIQMFLAFGIRLLCYAPIMGIGGVLMALRRSSSMSWVLGLAVIILLGMISVVFTVAIPKFKLIQKLIDKLNLVSRETLGGLMEIRAFGTREHEKKRFDAANKDLTKVNLFISRVMTVMMPLMMFIMNGITVLIVWVGSHAIADSQMQVGDMLAFMQYAMMVIMAFLMISMMFIFIPRAAVSADRIAEVLATQSSINDPPSPKEFDQIKKGYIEFKNVSFRYFGANEDALENISFVAKPGETTALIGSTGSGKTTVANMMLRFYDATSGQVLVDGVDVKEVRQTDLREKIGYIPQKGVLLSGTIESNLKYGNNDASEELVKTSAEVAQAMEFISEKEGGFLSDIAQGGTNVSGGQKQRLSIARALAKEPEIFIFDDSFSALDFKTDVTLRKALKEHTGDSTVIIVAQRVSTIKTAEQIIVLDEGRIVGKGTHSELLISCPEYYEIASSQLSKEEL